MSVTGIRGDLVGALGLQMSGVLLLLSAAQLPEREIASQSPVMGHTPPL